MDQRAALRIAATHAIRLAVEVIDIIYNAAGTTAIYDDHFIQRAFQDIHVISQHTQARRGLYELVGRHCWACPSTPRSSEAPTRHHGCSRPSQVQKRPCWAALRPAMSWRMPLTLSSTDSVAPRPPMSVRTQPGCMTMATSPSAPHAAPTPGNGR